MGSIIETVPALRAAGLIGLWDTDVRAARSVLDRGAAEALAGNANLAGIHLPMEVALGRTHLDDRSWLFERIGQVRRTGGPFSAEFRIVSATGEIRWILCRGSLAPDPSGAMRGMGVYIDTTDSHSSPFIAAGNFVQRSDDPLSIAADHCIEAHTALKRSTYRDLQRLSEMLLMGLGRALSRHRRD